MTSRTKKILLIANTVLWILATPLVVGVQLASVMGGAAATGHEMLGSLIVMLGLGFLFPPIISIIGSWATMKWTRISMLFIALPWVYALVLGTCIALLFGTA